VALPWHVCMIEVDQEPCIKLQSMVNSAAKGVKAGNHASAGIVQGLQAMVGKVHLNSGYREGVLVADLDTSCAARSRNNASSFGGCSTISCWVLNLFVPPSLCVPHVMSWHGQKH
jgi:hypothetical protein